MNRFVCLVLFASFGGALQPSTSFAAAPGFKVTTDKTVDTTSLESIVKDVLARSGAKTNDEKAIAIYEYLHNTIFHFAYPTEAAPQSVGPLKVINAYGWSLCGGQHTILKALYEANGWKCRYLGWPGHTTIEVFYDGRWHYLDVFLKCYYWTKDKSHIASQEEIANDPSIVLDAPREGRAARQNLCCGDLAADVVEGCKARRVEGDQQGWASITWRDQNYSPILNLPSGAALRLDWKADENGLAGKSADGSVVTKLRPQHTCGIKDFRGDTVLGPMLEHYGPRNWSNGALTYTPDFSKPADLADIQLTGAKALGGKLVANGKGVAVFKLPLPYPYVSGSLALAFDGGEGKTFVSTDAGKSWKESGPDITKEIKQKYDLWLKIEFPATLTRFGLTAMVEHNRSALPYLVPGKNAITVSVDPKELSKSKDQVLIVTYVYQEAIAPGKRQQFDGQGLKYGEAKRITKEVTSLPFTFVIDVGGNTPPKMIALERAVRAR
jgi:hypothetical protein